MRVIKEASSRRVAFQQGFTLIEALVALLVLSIGMLGVAAMQLKAVQSAHIGYQRSYATLIAVDAQERLWKNLADDLDKQCPLDPEVLTISNGWKDHWFSSGAPLTNVNSVIRRKGDCNYEVIVDWTESRADGAASTFVYSFRLPEL